MPPRRNGKILAICGVTLFAAFIVSLGLAILKLQLRFKNREAAASILAGVLKRRVRSGKKTGDGIIVVGIPRGGVITAQVVARELSVNFGIIIAAKLGEPENKECAIGAIMEDGTLYLDKKRVNELQITPQYVYQEKSAAEKELDFRRSLYSNASVGDQSISGRTVILVDDGAATGSSLIAAARSIRKKGPRELIIAVPVCSTNTAKLLKAEADHVDVILSPSPSVFVTVGHFYESFVPLTHEDVIKTLCDAGLRC